MDLRLLRWSLQEHNSAAQRSSAAEAERSPAVSSADGHGGGPAQQQRKIAAALGRVPRSNSAPSLAGGSLASPPPPRPAPFRGTDAGRAELADVLAQTQAAVQKFLSGFAKVPLARGCSVLPPLMYDRWVCLLRVCPRAHRRTPTAPNNDDVHWALRRGGTTATAEH